MFEMELETVHRLMKRAEKHDLQHEVVWTALELALDNDFKETMEKQGVEVNLELCLLCACQDWDV